MHGLATISAALAPARTATRCRMAHHGETYVYFSSTTNTDDNSPHSFLCLRKRLAQTTTNAKPAHPPHHQNLSTRSSKPSHRTPRTARCSSSLLPTLSPSLYLKDTWSGGKVSQLTACTSLEQACCARRTASRRLP